MNKHDTIYSPSPFGVNRQKASFGVTMAKKMTKEQQSKHQQSQAARKTIIEERDAARVKSRFPALDSSDDDADSAPFSSGGAAAVPDSPAALDDRTLQAVAEEMERIQTRNASLVEEEEEFTQNQYKHSGRRRGRNRREIYCHWHPRPDSYWH